MFCFFCTNSFFVCFPGCSMIRLERGTKRCQRARQRQALSYYASHCRWESIYFSSFKIITMNRPREKRKKKNPKKTPIKNKLYISCVDAWWRSWPSSILSSAVSSFHLLILVRSIFSSFVVMEKYAWWYKIAIYKILYWILIQILALI